MTTFKLLTLIVEVGGFKAPHSVDAMDSFDGPDVPQCLNPILCVSKLLILYCVVLYVRCHVIMRGAG